MTGVAAIVDHQKKQTRIVSAELDDWYCSHDGTRCGGADPDGIEAHWNQRQLGYEITVSTLGGSALLLLGSAAVGGVRRRRRVSRSSQDGTSADASG
ncbi:MAG: hypothetical protein ACRDL2_02730 [Gaiellaceae bacterium]